MNRHLLTVAVAALALAPAVATAPAAAATPAPPASPLRLPAPTGPFVVGARFDWAVDHARLDPETGRARTLPIRVWYPARPRGDEAPAPYFSPAVQAWAEARLGLPGVFAIDTHALADAPARQHVRGVLLVQPGGGSLSAFQTGQVIDLASRGYAVVTMDHPHESLVAEQPGGRLIVGPDDSYSRPFVERIDDAGVVLRALARLVPQAGPSTPIGMFGHSRGGGAAPEVMFHHPRVQAGVALDLGVVLFGDPDTGSPPGDVVAAGLDRPFGFMCSLQAPCDSPYLTDFAGSIRNAHPRRQLPVLHDGYNDFVVFVPEAVRAAPAVGAVLDSIWFTGTTDSVDAGRHALELQRRFLAHFFGRHLQER